MAPNKAYWEKRYDIGETGWDIGSVSPPLKTYIDQLPDKNIKILVPGAGMGHEVVYLYNNGFRNILVVDIARPPLEHLKKILPNFPKERLILTDFFLLKEKDFDLVLEQTFFCALPPTKRRDYVQKMAETIKDGGKLSGLFFNFPLTGEGPPFGGNEMEYRTLFGLFFKLKVLETAYNSIKPRKDSELFFIFEKSTTSGQIHGALDENH